MEWFTQLDHWHWWVLAVALVVLEIFAPGVIFLWIGVAAVLVGFVLLVMPDLDWQTQVFIFAILSVLASVAGRILVTRNQAETDQPSLNRRGEQYIGRTFTLDEPVVNGQGKIRVDDTTWKINGDDCDEGTTIRVTGVDGVVLVVEKA